MNRRRFLGASVLAAGAAAPAAAWALGGRAGAERALPARPLRVPADGFVRVAFAIGEGVNVIDTAGPWETFQDAAVNGGLGRFELYTVAASTAPVQASGGLAIQPEHSYREAPQPHVVVIPAHDAGDDTVEWIRRAAKRADLVMSVCTGAFVLAQTGLLDGRTATTHHGSWDDFAAMFPKVELLRGPRFVEHERVATAGGLTSGIDLALRVVERYLGHEAADATARYMEYQRA
jgi:transcriptional regulator GlxA family with amidase domain